MIKVGKAITALKRDGFFGGVGKIFRYLLVYLKYIFVFKSGDTLFIMAGVGDSALYRAHNQAEELRTHGFKVSVTMQDNPFLSVYSSKFKVFIFQRTIYTPSVAKLIAKIKRQKKEIIFDTDDLVFDAKYVQATDHYENMSYFEKKQYAKGVGEEILKDPYVEVCTTSTSFIASKLEEYGKRVFVVTNKLSDEWVVMAEELLKKKCHSGLDPESRNISAGETEILNQVQDDQKIRIGYFSGTVGHNKDFTTISDALVEILEKYPQVELFIAGPLELEDKFNKYLIRIKRSFYVQREKHFANIASCDIILAPLETGDPFCDGKSELKFFEAGILKVPVAAVRNQTFSEAIIDGENGFLAVGREEWVEKLSQLIEKKELRQQIGEKARAKALADYTTKNSHSGEYYEYLKKRLSI